MAGQGKIPRQEHPAQLFPRKHEGRMKTGRQPEYFQCYNPENFRHQSVTRA